MSTISLPLLTLKPPNAGWWPMHIDWQEERYTEWPSCVLRDPFIEMVVWLEAILMDALPAVWQVNIEEIQWPILAEKAGPETIHLTLYGKMLGAGFQFDLDRRNEYSTLASGTVSARQLAGIWFESLSQAISRNDFVAPEEWDNDLRRLDTSRLRALLAGQPIDDTWRPDYIDEKARWDRSVKLARQVIFG